MAKLLEKDIQLAICDYLELKKYFFWRQNNIPVFDKGRYRPMPKYSINGVPDIILLHKGTFWGLEVKRPKGKQSDSQKHFQQRTELNGCHYALVTSIDDVIALGL